MNVDSSQEKVSVAIISGGSGFIGRAIAKKLAADGMIVILLYRHTSESDMEQFLSTLSGTGHRAYRCDMTQHKEVEQVCASIAENYGSISACIHAAEAPIVRQQLIDSTPDQFEQQLSVGLLGGFRLFRLAAMLMKHGGTMVGITSTVTESNAPADKMGAYVPVKYAEKGMLRVLARELAPRQIRVHAVAPDFFPAGLNSDLPPTVAQFIFEKRGGKKQITVHDVASVVSFLCSEDAAHITGLSVPISGEDSVQL